MCGILDRDLGPDVPMICQMLDLDMRLCSPLEPVELSSQRVGRRPNAVLESVDGQPQPRRSSLKLSLSTVRVRHDSRVGAQLSPAVVAVLNRAAVSNRSEYARGPDRERTLLFFERRDF